MNVGAAPCSLELAGVCSLRHRQSRSSGVLRAERSYFRRSLRRLVKVLHPPNSHSKQVRVLGQFYLPISLFMLEIVALMAWFGKKSQRVWLPWFPGNLWSPVPIASMTSYGQSYLYFQKPHGLTYGFQHLLISGEENGLTWKRSNLTKFGSNSHRVGFFG
ncbi:hypothetical protein VNO77_22718 [Canavalia gladiata]|uniref:Uncharacterized protein n=1 Tax=Canavalia gladiata TaxID=3824 RepID=A0AAN9L338_CANGL